jgi:hypothetical protein
MNAQFPLAERSGATKTVMFRRSKRPPVDPVTAIKLMPKGPLWRFADFPARDGHIRWISLGSGEGKDIRIEREGVSKRHCMLRYDHQSAALDVLDCNSKNGTHLWEICLRGISIPVPSGMVLRVGEVELMVCGQAGGEQEPIVAGEDMAEFIHNAKAIHGSERRAAKALGVAQKTFSRWLTVKFPWK